MSTTRSTMKDTVDPKSNNAYASLPQIEIIPSIRPRVASASGWTPCEPPFGPAVCTPLQDAGTLSLCVRPVHICSMSTACADPESETGPVPYTDPLSTTVPVHV
ncbi:hypothetical protein Scep_019329 [Stephania cephalantha]|uniref:Uncharacterized protein n=1 Tax=Stephania cephalantha TaxID=152367 RepID=A0AAP0IAZ3_9MAGN